MPAHLKIIRDALQRLMRLAHEQLFLRRRIAQIRLLREISLNPAQPLGMVRNQPIHLLQKSRRTFNRLFAPLQIFFRRRGEQRVQATRIAAIFLGHLNRAYDVAARFRHRHAALLHHTLRKEPRNWLVVIHQPDVAHHLAEKSRIQQMQNRVRDSADVLVNRKPVTHFLLIERRGAIVRICVAIEIPGRINERIHRIRLAPRRTAAFRTRGVHKFRRTSQRRLSLPRKRNVFRQTHWQLIVRHRHDPIFFAVNDRNRRAPIALPRNAPIFQPVSRLASAVALRLRVSDHLFLRLLGGKPVVRPGIHQPAHIP